jgi:hypothetical protein
MIDNTTAIEAQPVEVNMRGCPRMWVPGEDCDEPGLYRNPEAVGRGSQKTLE